MKLIWMDFDGSSMLVDRRHNVHAMLSLSASKPGCTMHLMQGAQNHPHAYFEDILEAKAVARAFAETVSDPLHLWDCWDWAWDM